MIAKIAAAAVLVVVGGWIHSAGAAEPDYWTDRPVAQYVMPTWELHDAILPSAAAAVTAEEGFDPYSNTKALPAPCRGMIQHDCVTHVVALTVLAVRKLNTISLDDRDYATGHLIAQNDARQVGDALGALFNLTVGESDDLDLVQDAQATLKAAVKIFKLRIELASYRRALANSN